MNARVARSIERLDNIASELNHTVTVGFDSTKIGLCLGDPPPMFEDNVIKFRSSVNRVLHLAEQEALLTPQEAGEGEQIADLRDRFRGEYMIPLRRTGKPLLRFAPGIEKALKVPHKRASHRKLVTSAEVMLKAVQPYRKMLISAGFSKTFLTEFRDLTKELKRIARIATTDSRRKAKFDRVTEEISKELKTANETLGIIDGLVLSRAVRNSRLAKEWRALMKHPTRIGRPRSKNQRLSPTGMLAAGGS